MIGLKELSKLVEQEFDLKHPDYPSHLSKPLKKYRDKTANELTQAIIAFLRLKGHQCERISSTGRILNTKRTVTDFVGFQKEIGSVKWISGTGTKGTSDISSIIHGISIKIEIKIGKDRQSPAQKQYQKSVEDAGGVYLIVRSFQEFFDWYNCHIESLQRRITTK